MNRIIVVVSIFMSCCLISCTNSEKAYAIAPTEETNLEVPVPKVAVATVAQVPFAVEILSNGTLEAYRTATLKFQKEGMIEHLPVATGDQVQEGALIGQLETKLLELERQKNEQSIAKAKLDYQDLLLKMGYSEKDTLAVPAEIHAMATIRSGLAEYENQAEEIKAKFQQAQLLAPFTGVLADVEAQAHNLTASYKQVGVLMDLNSLWVNFKVLEEEIKLLRKGDGVEVLPFGPGEEAIYGKVEQINPLVDENGLVSVRALVKNNRSRLIDGMHVQVKIKKTVGNQIVLPKSAILDRNGRDIVFRYADEKAQWTYVQKSFENQDSVCILKGLAPGDQLIIHDHTNLAHQAPVHIDTTITTF